MMKLIQSPVLLTPKLPKMEIRSAELIFLSGKFNNIDLLLPRAIIATASENIGSHLFLKFSPFLVLLAFECPTLC